MKYIVFGLSLLTTLIKAQTEDGYCWSLLYGYPCCPQDTQTEVTDTSGEWGVYNGDWCGIIKNDGDDDCWSNVLGYSCCPDDTEVEYVDTSGAWGIFDGEWCGIKKYEEDENCWASKYGYPCCKDKTVKANYFDRVGDWYQDQNGSLCGVPYGECWSVALKTTYQCCTTDFRYDIVDQDGDWGIDKQGWCAIRHSKGGQPHWNNRELIKETKDKWNKFKDDWDNTYKHNYEDISVFVGRNETELNFSWYSKTTDKPYICWETSKSPYTDKCNGIEFAGTVEEHYILNDVQYYSHKVTVTGLERNSVYYYRRKTYSKDSSHTWESQTQFRTHDPDNFKFIFVGDPQIGGSVNRVVYGNNMESKRMNEEEAVRNDAFNWNMTITSAFELTDNKPSLILSAGDQIETMCEKGDQESFDYQEKQYAAFLLPQLLKKLPSATTVGNHESYTDNYKYHFNVPNAYEEPSYKNNWNLTGWDNFTPGYNYYFTYNNVLVIVLESTYSRCIDYETVIDKALTEHPDTDWRIVMFHHDIYGHGNTHSGTDDNLKRRPCLTRLMDRNGIDIVLTGHDHVYTVSKFITYVEKYDDQPKKVYKASPVRKGVPYKNPKGALYFTSNCSTGSKLYRTFNNTVDFAYNFGQPFASTFGVLDFQDGESEVSLTINVYEVDSKQLYDGPYNIVKDKCWAKRVEGGYDCCIDPNTRSSYTDKNGKWGIENGQWCGIIVRKSGGTTTTKTVPPKTSTRSTKTIPDEYYTTTTRTIITSLTPIKPTTTTTTLKTIPSNSYVTTTSFKPVPLTMPTTTTTTTTTTTRFRTTTTTTTTTSTKTIPSSLYQTTTTTTTTRRTTTTTTRRTTTTTTRRTTTTTTTANSSTQTNCAGPYEQCGGITFNGPTCCTSGYQCIEYHETYHQCQPKQNWQF